MNWLLLLLEMIAALTERIKAQDTRIDAMIEKDYQCSARLLELPPLVFFGSTLQTSGIDTVPTTMRITGKLMSQGPNFQLVRSIASV